jgi:predicted butyrate kinase (DUF1464 family)
LEARVNTFDSYDLLEGGVELVHGFSTLDLQGIFVLNGDIAYLLCQVGQDLSIKGLFEGSSIVIGFKVHANPSFQLCRVSVDDRVEPRCYVVLPIDGE